MSYSKIFFYACLSFIVGIFICSIWPLDFFAAYLVLLLAVILLLISWRFNFYAVFAFCCLGLFLGIIRYDFALPPINSDQVNFYNGQNAKLEGVIGHEPDVRQAGVKLWFSSQQIYLNESWQKISGLVLTSNDLYPEYDYGDKVELICDLQAPGRINGFNYDQYLSRYNVYSVCYYPKITLLSKGQGSFFLAAVYKAKNYFISTINRILPEPQSSFLGGLLIGAKRAIPDKLTTVFSQTGTTHIVAVSGYNVTILTVFLMLLAQNFGLPRKKVFWLIIGFLFVFVTITGLQASIFRASVMAVLALLATYWGRKSKIDNVLALTVVIMLLANPKILVFDLGFQLSFLATLGLIYLNPILVKLTKIANCKLRIVKLIIGDYFLTTISAIIMTTPIILYNFGKLSVIAPLANILVLPLIPLAMFLGFLTGILGMIFQPMGWVSSWLIWLVLSYMIWILEKLASLPWAYFEFAKISLWLLVISYFIILGFIWKFNKHWELT